MGDFATINAMFRSMVAGRQVGDPGETGEEARTCPQYLSAKVFSKVVVLPFIQLGEPCVSIEPHTWFSKQRLPLHRLAPVRLHQMRLPKKSSFVY